jgi:hypothetical protein
MPGPLEIARKQLEALGWTLRETKGGQVAADKGPRTVYGDNEADVLDYIRMLDKIPRR